MARTLSSCRRQFLSVLTSPNLASLTHGSLSLVRARAVRIISTRRRSVTSLSCLLIADRDGNRVIATSRSRNSSPLDGASPEPPSVTANESPLRPVRVATPQATHVLAGRSRFPGRVRHKARSGRREQQSRPTSAGTSGSPRGRTLRRPWQCPSCRLPDRRDGGVLGHGAEERSRQCVDHATALVRRCTSYSST